MGKMVAIAILQEMALYYRILSQKVERALPAQVILKDQQI